MKRTGLEKREKRGGITKGAFSKLNPFRLVAWDWEGGRKIAGLGQGRGDYLPRDLSPG